MRTRRSRFRISLAVLVVFALVGVFIVRLVDIQVVRAADLTEESKDRRAQSVTTYGVRGDIVDANGALLADSVERYDVVVSPRVVLGREDLMTKVMEDLAAIAAITGSTAEAMYQVMLEDPTSDWAQLARGLTFDQFTAIEELDIPWTYVELRPERVYPNGQIAANLVGFMGTDGPSAGLEWTEEQCLASEDGVATYERALDGTRLPGSKVELSEPRDGGILHTTIDRDLQWWVQQRMVLAGQQLGATRTSAVVIRVSDGALVSVTDWPTLDSNNVDASLNDLGSRAFSTPYEPGSVIKALTAASLVDAGVASPSSQVVAPYAIDLGEAGVISDAFPHDTMNLTLTGMLVESSNTATSQFSMLLDQDSRRDYLEKFGFGELTAAEFSGESQGTLQDYWDSRTNYTVQFGQGMTATAVQVASAFQALGNGGVRSPAHLVSGCELPDGTMTDVPSTEGVRVVSEQAANTTLEMMEQVTLQSGSGPLLQIPGYRVGVKSGTAEVAEGGQYTDKVVISYVGVAPIDDPQYVVLVTADIPDAIFSGVIAPVFQDVMSQTLTHFRVPPSTTPASNLSATW